MSHFLFMALPDRGHVYPHLAVVDELINRGHQVTYVTGPGMVEAVEATGATVVVYDSQFERLDLLELAATEGSDVFLSLFIDEGAAMIKVAEEHLGRERADVVAYDMFVLAAGRALARKWKVPAIRLTPVFASNDVFSVFPTIETDSDEPVEVPPGFEVPMAKGAALLRSQGIDDSIERFSAEIEAFNLVALPREFQFAGESFDERFVFTGPCLGDRAFLGEWKPSDDGLPVVLVSLGTVFNGQPEFFRACVEAFTGAPWHVVMTVGDGIDPADLGALPPNIEVHRWVPHLAVLEHAEVAVTHGGMGSVMEALYCGRPVVAVPCNSDVELQVQRITELGLGGVLSHEELTPEGLRRLVTRLAEDEAVLAAVRAMRDHIHNAGGTQRAADEIEKYLARAI
ncbi:macrolide family glycosyltransferase [Streptomyces sp. NPDC001530]|uniref:macrolide family glycosyltransferase n=1 Tax=Streptomyces sp. NPDC001530 TaxID=3364582 RepID=UPI0036CF0B21